MQQCIEQAVFGIGIFQSWWTLPTQSVWLILIAYTVVAGWSDLRTRTIPNSITLGAFCAILCVRISTGTGLTALEGLLLVGLLFLLPTLSGVWAQGDWKMAMTYGAAFGLAPLIMLWFTSLLLSMMGRRVTKQWSRKFMNESLSISIPLGLFVLCSTLLGYCTASLWMVR